MGIRSAKALIQPNPNTNWLPFGPNVDHVIYQYYSDFQAMFTAFNAGGSNGIDITDWPMRAQDTLGLCSNADFFCSSPTAQNGLAQLDINHAKSFLGRVQLMPRTTSPVQLSPTPPPTSGCSPGFASLTVTLENQETGNSFVVDSFNSMSMTQIFSGGGLGSSTTISSMGQMGRYTFPCLIAGTYVLSNSEYASCPANSPTSCEITLGSATTNSATFFTNWNSPSTQQSAQHGTYARQAIAHLLNKPQFIQGTLLQGKATCDDIYAAASQGFGLGYCLAPPSFPNCPNGAPAPSYSSQCQLPPDVRAVDCSAIHESEMAQGIPGRQQIICDNASPPADAYLLDSAATISGCKVWWGASGCSLSPENWGFPSSKDVQAACDLFVLAGFQVIPSGNTCNDVVNAAQASTPPPGYVHLVFPPGEQIVFYIRTDTPRQLFGQIMADGLNFLFGTGNNGANDGFAVSAGLCAVNYGYKSPSPGCTSQFYNFNEIANIIYGDGTSPGTWNLYTGSEGFSVTPDELYGYANSIFASNVCGGALNTIVSNYEFECNPIIDTLTNAGETASTFLSALNIFQNASYIAVKDVVADPVYNLIDQFVALNCLNFEPGTSASLVNGLGTGWIAGSAGAYYTLLNAHANSAYTPTNSAYACGGGNDDILRRGQSQGSDSFSPFQALSIWDFDIIDEIWDSMLGLNPLSASSDPTYNLMVSSVSSSFNPEETSCSPGAGCVAGTTTQIWRLRPDASFQDGTRVSADDVVFSILSYRDVPSALLQSSVINVASAIALTSSTVQVKLTHAGAFDQIMVGSVPIIPHHVWGVACNWPSGSPEPASSVLQASQCANPAFDPMMTGLMIGSGPYECLALPGTNPSGLPPGTPGGSCSVDLFGQPAGQTLSAGEALLLTAFPGYLRGPVSHQGSSYQRFSWADKFNAGIVTIADIASAALWFHDYNAYWASPLYSSTATCLPLTTSFTSSPPAFSYAAGGTYTFTATTSAGDFTSVGPDTYSWNFGPGEGTGTGNPVTHTFIFNTPVYSVSENVRDSSGLTGSTVPNSGSLQCVDIGVIAAIASYIGVGAVYPLSLSSTGLDPNIDRFGSGNAPPSGPYYLAAKQTSSTSVRLSVGWFTGTPSDISSISAQSEDLSGTCSTSGPIAPDGPGRSTYACMFSAAISEVEFVLTFSNGATAEIHFGPPQ